MILLIYTAGKGRKNRIRKKVITNITKGHNIKGVKKERKNLLSGVMGTNPLKNRM